MRDAFGVDRSDISKASILKPNMGLGPTLSPKDMKNAATQAKKVASIKTKKAKKIMNQPQEGTQVAPGVREYKPAPTQPKPPKAPKQKKNQSFLQRNRTGLMWGAGGVGAGGLGGYALSKD